MIREHAIAYVNQRTVAELDYICSKANSLGRKGRKITRVYQEEDSEGFHLYFEVVNEQERCHGEVQAPCGMDS